MSGLNYKLRDGKKFFDLFFETKKDDKGNVYAKMNIQGEETDLEFDPMSIEELEELRDYIDLVINKIEKLDTYH